MAKEKTSDSVAVEETIAVEPAATPVAEPAIVGDAEPIDMSIGTATNEAATFSEKTYNEPSQGELTDQQWEEAQKAAAKAAKSEDK